MSKHINPSVDRFNPPGAPYFMNLVHKDRASLTGHIREFKSFIKRPVPSRKKLKFVVFSRARSGSTLLTGLLDQLEPIKCDREILNKAVFFPHSYLNRLADCIDKPVYGCKILSYQLIEVQKLADPFKFFSRLCNEGVQIIHLRRGSLAQSLSITIASESGLYHQKGEAAKKSGLVDINVDHFIRRLKWNAKLLEYENRLMSEVPHMEVSYERDLLVQENQQPTIDKIAEQLGIVSNPVQARLSKILSPKLQDIAANSDEIVRAIHGIGMEKILEEL